jgi:hypothetical protein
VIRASGLVPVLGLRPQATWRAMREQGLWLQWEGIYRRALYKDAGIGAAG